jgi:hypothetical protein
MKELFFALAIALTSTTPPCIPPMDEATIYYSPDKGQYAYDGKIKRDSNGDRV